MDHDKDKCSSQLLLLHKLAASTSSASCSIAVLLATTSRIVTVFARCKKACTPLTLSLPSPPCRQFTHEHSNKYLALLNTAFLTLSLTSVLSFHKSLSTSSKVDSVLNSSKLVSSSLLPIHFDSHSLICADSYIIIVVLNWVVLAIQGHVLRHDRTNLWIHVWLHPIAQQRPHVNTLVTIVTETSNYPCCVNSLKQSCKTYPKTIFVDNVATEPKNSKTG